MGTTLRTVIEEIGGGIPGGKKFKAAQTGGPSGGCIPAEHFDIPIDYDNLIAIGSMMGSGGLIVMDEDDCMVDIAKFFLEFTVEESCGKCTACRIGTKRMLEILTKITKGQADMADLDKLEELCYYVKNNSLCGLGCILDGPAGPAGQRPAHPYLFQPIRPRSGIPCHVAEEKRRPSHVQCCDFLRSSPVGSGNSASPCPQHHLDCGRSSLSGCLRGLGAQRRLTRRERSVP